METNKEIDGFLWHIHEEPDEEEEKQFYVAYLTKDEIQTLYQALDCYENWMGPLDDIDRKEQERVAIVTDALKRAENKEGV